MSLYNSIQPIMDRFDFEKVVKVMTFLNWTWAGYHAQPQVEDLKAAAFSLMSQCVDEYERRGRPLTGMLFATGGFEATVQVFESGDARLQLLFYVDSCSR